MDNEYEWGPWIEHDGSGCPCVGEWVTSVSANGDVNEHVAFGYLDDMEGFIEVNSWIWSECYMYGRSDWRIIRYRIRKPRSKSMDILRALAQDPSLPINAPTGPVRELTPS